MFYIITLEGLKFDGEMNYKFVRLVYRLIERAHMSTFSLPYMTEISVVIRQ